MKIYLDICCFNRPFDDQSQLRIQLETEAKLKIQEEIRVGTLQLIWSYILDYENRRNPFRERTIRISNFKNYAIEDVEESPTILTSSQYLQQVGFSKIDSLHVSCAIFANCDYFLTTDDKILTRSKRIETIAIDDPIGFIKKVMI